MNNQWIVCLALALTGGGGSGLTGSAAATLVNGKSAQILSSSAGSASSTPLVEITGELSGNTLVGDLEAVSTTDECNTDRTAITLTRQ